MAYPAQQRENQLFAELADWQKARDLRQYLAALRAREDLEPGQAQRIAEWCDYGDRVADALDPVSDAERLPGLEGLS